MSRLIDVDKAENDIIENVTTKAVSRVVAILQGQPTVKAIPIEWIEERLQRAVAFTHSKAEGKVIVNNCIVEVVSASFTANVLLKLLEAWEDENEKDI